MKKYSLLLLLLLSIKYSFAQFYEEPPYLMAVDKYTVLDSANIKISYEVSYVKDKKNPQEKSRDIHTLLIGSKTSKYFSQNHIDFSASVREGIKAGKYTETVPSTPHGIWGMEVYKTVGMNEMKVIYPQSPLRENVLYTEPIPTLDWTITNDTCTVASYLCNKATTKFRGREYNVWFTFEIPINNGPWKLQGVPGLILLATDSDSHYTFKCVGIEYLKRKEPIVSYDLKYSKMSRVDFNKVCLQFHRNKVPFIEAKGGAVFKPNASKEARHTHIEQPYNPLELE